MAISTWSCTSRTSCASRIKLFVERRENSERERVQGKKIEKKNRKELRSSASLHFSPLFFVRSVFSSALLKNKMAVGKNKRVSKRGKGGRKKAYVNPDL